MKEPLDYGQKPLRGYRDRKFRVFIVITFVGLAFTYGYLALEDHPVLGDSIWTAACLLLGMLLSVIGAFGFIWRLGVLQDEYHRQKKQRE